MLKTNFFNDSKQNTRKYTKDQHKLIAELMEIRIRLKRRYPRLVEQMQKYKKEIDELSLTGRKNIELEAKFSEYKEHVDKTIETVKWINSVEEEYRQNNQLPKHTDNDFNPETKAKNIRV